MNKKNFFVNLAAVIIFLLISLLVVSSRWLGDTFGQVSYEQFLFHAMAPSEGVNMEMIFSYLRQVGWALLFAALYIFVLFKLCAKDKFKPLKIVSLALLVPYLLVSLFYVEYNHGIAAYYTRPASKLIEENYKRVTPDDVVFPGKRHNLILVILESMEETYNNKEVFGRQLMPNLDKLRSQHTSFYGFDHFLGTGWTIAALTSFFFGVPLKLPIDGNSYDAKVTNAFLPGAMSILEVLESHGYKIDVFMGSRATFSGKDNLFKTHTRGATLHDLHYFGANHQDISPQDMIDWGLRDSYIYARAREFLAANYNQDFAGNFMVIIETVDTHSPKDYYVAPGNPQKFGDFRDAVIMADKMAAGFVAWAMKQPFAKDTTIIVMGDHDLMAFSIADIDMPDYAEREIYNVFINPVPSIARQQQKRSFASFDLAPTILESVGASLPEGRFGIGVSLFGDSPTVYETLGYDAMAEEMDKPCVFYNNFYTHGR